MAATLIRRFRCGAIPLTVAFAGLALASGPQTAQAEEVRYALVLHGGASGGRDAMSDERRDATLAAMRKALAAGRDVLAAEGSALDAVEATVRVMEDDPLFNAGRGAVFDSSGKHTLDASIMDGRTLAGGGVAGVTVAKNPISLARLVMERTRHVLLAADGADAFAREMKVPLVDQKYYFTQERYDYLQKVLQQRASEEADEAELPPGGPGNTVGAVALDSAGNLAAATSTGGLTAKMPGRVGDSPILSAGTYADNRSCAVSGTGTGEEFIRNALAFSIAQMVRREGLSLRQAVNEAIFQVLEPGDGAVIAVSKTGEMVSASNTGGLPRGMADSTGRFDVAIWYEEPQGER